MDPVIITMFGMILSLVIAVVLVQIFFVPKKPAQHK